MTEPNFSINFSAQMIAATACERGDLLVYDEAAGYWKVSTSANRSTANARSQAIALTDYGGSVVGKVAYKDTGIIPASLSGLAAGSASWVRCSATGTIERFTPSAGGTDDIIGYAEADGRVHLCFGVFTADRTLTLGSGVAAFLATPSSANLRTALTDETGSGAAVFGTSPTITSPTITGSTGASSAMAALAIDWSVANVFTKTLSAGGNTITFSNSADGQVIIVVLTGAASTVTWPTVSWAGGAAPTQTASGIDVYTFVKAGSTIYGSVVQAMA